MNSTSQLKVGDLAFTVDLTGGDGRTPVLLLHGFAMNRTMWRPLLETLADAGYRGVAPDQRGYSVGARPASAFAYAVQALLGDALDLMDSLGAERFHLVGHDWGGQLAWLLAAHYSHRIISLSVISRPHPAAFARAMKEDPGQAERSGHHRVFRGGGAAERLRATGLQSLKDRLVEQSAPAERVQSYVEALMEPGAIEAALNWYRGGSFFDLAKTPKIPTPTLYVWGLKDDTVGALAAELTADCVDGPYEFAPIGEGGHFVVDQMPLQVADLILRHIQRSDGRAPVARLPLRTLAGARPSPMAE